MSGGSVVGEDELLQLLAAWWVLQFVAVNVVVWCVNGVHVSGDVDVATKLLVWLRCTEEWLMVVTAMRGRRRW